MTALVWTLAVGAWLPTLHTVVNAILLRRPPREATVGERVSILVPARNESARIGACVAALSAQTGLSDWELLVLDDDSSDDTAEVARRAAGARAVVRTGGAPPADRLGKANACAQLGDAATGAVLVFVDADVVCRPDAVARAVALLRDGGLALVSPYPRQLAGSWLERLVQPLLQWSFLTFLPLRVAERSARPALTAANGQLLVVDAAAYRRAGGHAGIGRDVVEDIALARAVKASGGRVSVADGTGLADCRMYDGAGALVDGYAKWLWSAFGSPGAGLTVATGLVVLYVLAWALIPLAPWAWVAAVAGPAGRVVSAMRTGARRFPDPIAHPLSVLAFAALVAVSVVRHRRGALTWKGRRVS